MLLPPCRTGAPGDGADGVAAALDALVLVGGGDIDPASYGQAAHPATAGVDVARDGWERALLAAALERHQPVLAICRGLQLLNVHLGGTLLQHLPDSGSSTSHQPAPGCFTEVKVAAEPGSRVAAALGRSFTVACSHHQSVDRLGRGLAVTARWLGDNVVEAVELPDVPFTVGVQWHPEETGDATLFDAVVAAAGGSQ